MFTITPNSSNMANTSLACGAQVFADGKSLGYLGDGLSINFETTTADLRQGEPSVFVGSRIASQSGTITLPLLELTPQTQSIAAGLFGYLSNTTTRTEPKTELLRLQDQETAWLTDPVVAGSIVVESEDGATTYTLESDYTIQTDHSRAGIARTPESRIDSGATVKVGYNTQIVETFNFVPFGFARQPSPCRLTIAKWNPGKSMFIVWEFWKCVPTGESYAPELNAESTEFLQFDAAFRVLSDGFNTEARHDKAPFGVLTEISASQFDPSRPLEIPADAELIPYISN